MTSCLPHHRKPTTSHGGAGGFACQKPIVILFIAASSLAWADSSLEIASNDGSIRVTSGSYWQRTAQLGQDGLIVINVTGKPAAIVFENLRVRSASIDGGDVASGEADNAGMSYLCRRVCNFSVGPGPDSSPMLLRLGDAEPPIRLEIAQIVPSPSATAHATLYDSTIANLAGGAVILTLLSASWLVVQQARLSERMGILRRSLSEVRKGLDETNRCFITLRSQLDLIEADLTRISSFSLAPKSQERSGFEISPATYSPPTEAPPAAEPSVAGESGSRNLSEDEAEPRIVWALDRVITSLQTFGKVESAGISRLAGLRAEIKALTKIKKALPLKCESHDRTERQLETLRNAVVVQAADWVDSADPKRVNLQLQNELTDLVAKADLIIIAPGRNAAFDPRLHAAVRSFPRRTLDDRPRAVAQVLSRGFRYGDQILRQASVALFE